MRFQATVLIDNTTVSPELKAEHGLSILITAGDGYRLLLDTGDTGAFLDNAAALGTDLNGLDALVLSHGHYDHTGRAVHPARAVRPAEGDLFRFLLFCAALPPGSLAGCAASRRAFRRWT